MAERAMSSLIVADPANIYYLTGYNAGLFYLPQCLIAPVEGDCHLFTRTIDAAGAHYTAFLPADQVAGPPPATAASSVATSACRPWYSAPNRSTIRHTGPTNRCQSHSS